MNPDTFNMSIRKFLKTVGVHSQREIEAAVERARAAGKLKGNETLDAKMTLTVDGVELNVAFDGKISLE
jgi:ribosomal protein L1